MEILDRRRLLLTGATGLAIAAFGCGEKAHARDAHDESGEEKHEEKGEDVAPPEDLMREHGVLNRILLVYEETARRLEAPGPALPIEAFSASVAIIRRFIEDYHEKLEEEFLFPRFEAKGKLVDLVATLRRQHQAGRRLTEDIQGLATPALAENAEQKKKIVVSIRAFIRMYRPHEAREDTVLFPALRGVVTPKEFEQLGELFEDREHALFGKAGFEGIVTQVEQIEQALGIYDLNQFTPAG